MKANNRPYFMVYFECALAHFKNETISFPCSLLPAASLALWAVENGQKRTSKNGKSRAHQHRRETNDSNLSYNALMHNYGLKLSPTLQTSHKQPHVEKKTNTRQAFPKQIDTHSERISCKVN